MTSDRLTHGHYYPAIDGLRTFAVLAVIAYHGSKTVAPGGFLGVDVFFVISGFVITLTLLREHERSGRIALGAFYLRRFWRLTPALVAAVLLAGVIAGLTRATNVWSYVFQSLTGLTYTYNLAQVVTDNRGGGILSHLWSLSVEEQFYLVWAPLLAVGLAVLAARRARLAALVAGTAVFFAARIVTYLTLGGLAAFFLPWARFDQFLIGAAVAVILHHSKGSAPAWIRSPWLPTVAVLAIAAGALLTSDLLDSWLYFGGYTASALLAAVIIAHSYVEGPSYLRGVLSSSPLVWLGQRSYGIYLYHYPVVQGLRVLHVPGVLHIPLSLAAAVLLATVSYRFLEEPLRRRGQRGRRRVITRVAAADPA